MPSANAYINSVVMPIIQQISNFFKWTIPKKPLNFKQVIDQHKQRQKERTQRLKDKWKQYKAPKTIERMSLSTILKTFPLPKEAAFFDYNKCKGLAVLPAKICILGDAKDAHTDNLLAYIEDRKKDEKKYNCNNKKNDTDCDRIKKTIQNAHDDLTALTNADKNEYKQMLLLIWTLSLSPSGELHSFTPREDHWLLIRSQARKYGSWTYPPGYVGSHVYQPAEIHMSSSERISGVLMHELSHQLLYSIQFNDRKTATRIQELYSKYKPKLMALGRTGIVYGGHNTKVIETTPLFTKGIDLYKNETPYVPYMATNIDEFFAVAVETWFDAPYFLYPPNNIHYDRCFLNREAMLKFMPDLGDLLGSMFLPWTFNHSELTAAAAKIDYTTYPLYSRTRDLVSNWFVPKIHHGIEGRKGEAVSPEFETKFKEAFKNNALVMSGWKDHLRIQEQHKRKRRERL